LQLILIILILVVIGILISKNLPEFSNVESWEENTPNSTPNNPLPFTLEVDQNTLKEIIWKRLLASRKVEIPALFLMGMGAINLAVGSIILVRSIQIFQIPIEDFERNYEEAKDITRKIMPEAAINLDRQDLTIAEIKKQTIWINAGYGAFLLLGSYLMLAGGYAMRKLRSLRLIILGVLYCGIPCISCAGSCGMGQAIAIWCLIVLFDPQVRQMFTYNPKQQTDSKC